MKTTIKVNEIFESVQGEGKYAGYPMLFIRLSGCNRNCSWCDTKYHIKGKNLTIDKLVEIIKKSKANIICWTGGEPLLQKEAMREVMLEVDSSIKHHLETNGDLLDENDLKIYDYIAISPKDIKTIESLRQIYFFPGRNIDYNFKVVTDLIVGKNIIKKLKEISDKEFMERRLMLMPLTTYNKKKDLEIQKRVWNYCVKNNIRFAPRYQYWIFGKKKGV